MNGLGDGTVCSSAALLMPPNWDKGLVSHRVVMPPRESLAGWGHGPAAASCSPTRISVESGEEQPQEPEGLQGVSAGQSGLVASTVNTS